MFRTSCHFFYPAQMNHKISKYGSRRCVTPAISQLSTVCYFNLKHRKSAQYPILLVQSVFLFFFFFRRLLENLQKTDYPNPAVWLTSLLLIFPRLINHCHHVSRRNTYSTASISIQYLFVFFHPTSTTTFYVMTRRPVHFFLNFKFEINSSGVDL